MKMKSLLDETLGLFLKKIVVCQKTLEFKDQNQFKVNIWTPEKARTKDTGKKNAASMF